MNITNAVRTAAISTLAIGAGFAALLAAPAAEARRYVKPYYSETYDFDKPVRGYEGWVAPDYYCSYKRHPKRVCSTNARGKETCRVRGWTLEQTCQ